MTHWPGRAVAVLVAAMLWASGLAAETVRVMSGEHPGFTRLALVLPRESAWQVGRIEGGYGLKLNDPDITLDLSRAFDLIPRDRVSTLAFDPAKGLLSISSSCACHANAFQIGSRIVVVDIADGPAAPGHPFEVALYPLAPPASAGPARAAAAADTPDAKALPPLLSDDMRRRYDRQITLPDQHRAGPADPRPAPEQTAPERPPGSTDPFAEAEERRRIAEIEAELLKQLARAGAQGMVTANPRYGGLEGEVARPDASTPPSNHPGANVDAITGVDRAAPDAPPPPDDAREACITPEVFAFFIAESDVGPPEMIANARRALLREFDAPDTQAAEALARVYLHLGFGAEARQVVDGFLAGTARAPLYRALAAALDNTPQLAGQGLTGQAGCPGAASFWAMLVAPVPATLSEQTRRAVAATASDLPLHLRRWVVPRLGQRLLARGHDELAAILRDSLARVAGEQGAGFLMLQAALAERGDSAAGDGPGAPSSTGLRTAETLFEEVAKSNRAEAPEALVERIRLANAQGQTLTPNQVALAEALIFEHRDTPLARRLMIGLAPAQARDGAFGRAFESLDAASALPAADRPDPLLPEARSATAILLARNASDEIFLRTLFDPARAGLGTVVAPEAAFAVASRLLALGFPEQALAQSRSLPPEPAYRLMRVRALMALGRNQRALASLAGLQGTQSDALRGVLLARLGENGPAHVISRVAGDKVAARRAAWASGEASAIRESGSASEAGFTEATRPENSPAVPARPTLSGTRDLLEQIRSRRAAIETLLQEKSASTGALSPKDEISPTAPGT